jgi:hypothetical protein
MKTIFAVFVVTFPGDFEQGLDLMGIFETKEKVQEFLNIKDPNGERRSTGDLVIKELPTNIEIYANSK